MCYYSTMKICTSCGLEKPTNAFGIINRITNSRNVACRECLRLRQKRWYGKNLESVRARKREESRRYRQVQIDEIKVYLSTHPCIDCGESDIVVLEFDHRETTEKYKAISMMLRNKASWETIKKEIDKCDVRCCNCHRRRTAKQLGWATRT